jgi:hypothetical protein
VNHHCENGKAKLGKTRTEEATDLVRRHESEGELLWVLERDLPDGVALRVIPMPNETYQLTEEDIH